MCPESVLIIRLATERYILGEVSFSEFMNLVYAAQDLDRMYLQYANTAKKAA